KAFEDFNRKYPGIFLKLAKLIDRTYVGILLNESSAKAVFDKASKLKGLSHIGIQGFEEAAIEDSTRFAQLADAMTNQVFLTYTSDIGTETIAVRYNEKEAKMEFLYDLKSIKNPLTPQFQLLIQYMGQPTDPNINIMDTCHQVGFIDVSDEALHEWQDEFFPKMLE
ncbi:hypothetical protein GOV09_04895, partial [Candidatus Woesearchaeota archaeon]|nr:hypothetical protein [Candidatus Woesearchaeota archaeon]